ncbi:MAG: hypothetical protein K0U67_05330 [Actinomycetia bacterium]|nr:hypothetical protein [Actinomycetes bacterium]
MGDVWHLDIPSESELRLLAAISAPAVVSIYLPTTPISKAAAADAIELRNLVADAMTEVRRLPALPRGDDEYIEEQLLDLVDDEDFWAHQSYGLGVITTANGQWTFRLPHRPTPQAHVDDKAHLVQLISATAARDAHVLCLSEGAVRLVDVAADLPAKEVRVADLPTDAASAVGKSSINDRSPSGRLVGSEGKRVRIRQYARAVDDALMPLLRGDERPLVLIATEPINSIFRQVCSAPTLLTEGVEASPDRWSLTEISDAVSPVLDNHVAESDAALASLVNERRGQRRATTDLSDIARAATISAVATLIIDRDHDERGTVGDDGALILDPNGPVLAEELARRVVAHGGRVVALPSDRLPGGAPITAILRYAR